MKDIDNNEGKEYHFEFKDIGYRIYIVNDYGPIKKIKIQVGYLSQIKEAYIDGSIDLDSINNNKISKLDVVRFGKSGFKYPIGMENFQLINEYFDTKILANSMEYASDKTPGRYFLYRKKIS